MKSDFSSLAFVFRQNLVASGISISLGHTQQLLAASLGYGRLAAIQSSTEEAPGIAGADFVILDIAGLPARAAFFGLGSASDRITGAVVAANTNAYFEGAYLEATDPDEALKDSREFWEVPVDDSYYDLDEADA